MNVETGVFPGVLAYGVRPSSPGWYWCQRKGFAAPECVYFKPAYRLAAADCARIMTVSLGDVPFEGTDYDRDDTHWLGPFGPPPVCNTWSMERRA